MDAGTAPRVGRRAGGRPTRARAASTSRWRSAPDLPPVLGDEGAVAQILLNLVLNACDAVRDGGGGRVRLAATPAHRATRAGDAAGAPDRPPDAVVCVVADEGTGIAEEDRERIFAPFFTTKDPGEGTGLGLSNAARLAEQMGGTLELVEAPPGDAHRLRVDAAPWRQPGGIPLSVPSEAAAGPRNPFHGHANPCVAGAREVAANVKKAGGLAD